MSELPNKFEKNPFQAVFSLKKLRFLLEFIQRMNVKFDAFALRNIIIILAYDK